MAAIINFGTEARNKLKAGVDTLAAAVRTTYGPNGSGVVI